MMIALKWKIELQDVIIFFKAVPVSTVFDGTPGTISADLVRNKSLYEVDLQIKIVSL